MARYNPRVKPHPGDWLQGQLLHPPVQLDARRVHPQRHSGGSVVLRLADRTWNGNSAVKSDLRSSGFPVVIEADGNVAQLESLP